MASDSPPPPPTYSNRSPSSSPTPRPEKRWAPPASSLPVVSRFSPQRSNDPPQPPHLLSSSSHSPSPLLSPQETTTPSPAENLVKSGGPYFISNDANLQSPGGSNLPIMRPYMDARADGPVPRLSNPPSPPQFTSPFRPPASTFSPPVSHQPAIPAAISPVSSDHVQSLPISSFFSNSSASVDLQKGNASTITDELALSKISPHVVFSAHKVLKHKKLWNVPSLGFGAFISPGKEVTPSPQTVQHSPHRCGNCGAYVNLYCDVILSSGQWTCIICKKLNGSDGEYRAVTKDELCNWPELSLNLVDYVETGIRRPGFVPVSDSRMSAPVFLVIDECLDEPHLQHLQSSLHEFVDSLPPTIRIGIITYGRTVSVYDFSDDTVASADVLPGSGSPNQESLKALIYGTGIYLSPVHVSRPVCHNIFSSMMPYKLSLPEASRDRCLGVAVEVALAIIQGPSADAYHGAVKRAGGSCRILVCAGGPNTYGPGSVPHSFTHPNYAYMEKTAMKWMEQLGHKAHLHDIVVDILCAGTCPVRIPVLQPLAKASGGVLVLNDDFGEAFGANLRRAATRSAGSHGMFEIRCSDSILVTQIIGPGEEATSDTHENFESDSATYVQMISVEETQSFCVSMEAKNDIKENHIYFQFAIRYSNSYQADISRIITLRLAAVDGLSSYLESVQDEVAATLIGKRALLHAKNSAEASDMRFTIDERVKDISLRFGTQISNSKFHRFPKELSMLPENLFHLRRGPLLGSIIGHEDERSVLRNIFLNASFDLSVRMLAPRCLMHCEGGTFEELPAYDLAMQSDAAVVLDHGTDVFIWLGADLAAQEAKNAAALAACKTLAEELTEQRFPAPRILAFKEGSSQARYFVSRLIPAHKDPAYEQVARFPQLSRLTNEQRTKLKSSFLHVDDLSFCEWMRSLKLVPPEPS
ncbi:transport protein SEC23-1 [Nymphaea thermarum]|nr:transport protein SEC23-1 [Nymphaea thermarum]